MKRRVLSLLLALAMVAALAGCGGGSAASQQPASDGSDETPEAVAEPTAEPTPPPEYRLVGAARYEEGELTVQYALTYAAAGDSLPSAVRETRPDEEYETAYTYLADGRIATSAAEGDQRSSRIERYYDEAGQLVWQAEVMRGMYYDANNEPAGWYTDREYSDYAYDEAGQLIAVTTVNGSGERRTAQEYTYTDGQRTGEKNIYYYMNYDIDPNDPTSVEDVTEYTYAYDGEGRLARRESYTDGEMTSAVDYTYTGPMRLGRYASGAVNAALLAGGDEQLLSLSVPAEAGEPTVEYDDAGCPVRIGAGESTYAEFTYEPYAPAPMAAAEAPAAVALDTVMLDNEYCTLTLKDYFAPYAVVEFENKSADAIYQLAAYSIELNGVGVPIGLRTAYTDPGQTSKQVVYLDPDVLARFGILYPETISATASLGQEEPSDSGTSYFTVEEGLTISAELPVPAGAEGPSTVEPTFGREPVVVAATDEYKITLVDGYIKDDQLRLTVLAENYTGRYMAVSVRGLSVNGTELPVSEYGNNLGYSYWEKGYMESAVGYLDGDMIRSDLSPIIEQMGPIQTVDVTLSVYLRAETGYAEPELYPTVTLSF